MQDGNSNKGKDEAKRGTIGQAHLMRYTQKHVFTVAATITHARIQKQERNAELQPNIIIIQAHLYNSTLTDWRHTHTFTQNPKEKKVVTSLCASSPSPATATPSSSGVVGELVLRAGTCWPLNTTDGVSGAISERIRGRGNC